LITRTDSGLLLPEEKLSLNESVIDDSEFTWSVKVKSTDANMKLERLLVVGPRGCRLHLPKSLDELDDIPYSKMKEFSYNAQHHVFQISWQPSEAKSIEIIFFHTKHCVEIHETIQKFLKDILRARSKDKDPDEIIAKCTYLRPANVSDLKKGGRFKTDTLPTRPPEGAEKIEKIKVSSDKSRTSRSRGAPTRSQSVQSTPSVRRPKRSSPRNEEKSPSSPKSAAKHRKGQPADQPEKEKRTNPAPSIDNERDLSPKQPRTKPISSSSPRSTKKQKRNREADDSSPSPPPEPSLAQSTPNMHYKSERRNKSPTNLSKSKPKLIEIGEEKSESS